jgi:hypothetical protein
MRFMQMHKIGNQRCRPASRFAAAPIALLIVITIGGCVQRRLTIRSNPPGARVYVGDEEVGTTPVSTDFVYYGTRKIRLVKDGFETMVVNQPIPAPWYQIPPLDFISENVIPGEIRDERVVNFQLVPLQAVSTDQLLARGEQLRSTSSPPVMILNSTAPAPAHVPLPAVETLPDPGVPGPDFIPPSSGAPIVPGAPPPYQPPQYLPPG